MGIQLTSNLATFHPRHLVQSTGLNGAPRIPAFLGLKEFKGRMIHSSEFHGATEKDYAGKRVIVVGSGNSAHDIAYDIHMNGGKVTMVQRGTTFVKTASTNLKDVASLYNEHTVSNNHKRIPTFDSGLL